MMERCKTWQYLLIATRNVNANMRNRDARFADLGDLLLKSYQCQRRSCLFLVIGTNHSKKKLNILIYKTLWCLVILIFAFVVKTVPVQEWRIRLESSSKCRQ